MTKTYKIFLTLLLLFFSLFSMFFRNFFLRINVESAEASSNYSEIVMEVNTNRVLYENDSSSKKYMASTTKILTSICVIENTDINKFIKINKNSVGIEGSSIYLKEDEEISIKELLYGLMLRSGNDCAVALALETSGTIYNFAKLMNETAEKIGAKNSNFTNPHGLHDDNHYTTAYDLALISCYAMKNPTFREIVSTKKITVSNTKGDYQRVLINKNKMLSSFDGCTGIKTGYTKKAGRCLVSSAKRNGMELVCVVLNCGPMWEESKNMLTSCFNNYSLYKIFESDNIVDFNKNDFVKTVAYIKNDVILPLTEEEYKTLRYEIKYDEDIDISIKPNDSIGKINFYLKNNLIFSEKIYTII